MQMIMVKIVHCFISGRVNLLQTDERIDYKVKTHSIIGQSRSKYINGQGNKRWMTILSDDYI